MYATDEPPRAQRPTRRRTSNCVAISELPSYPGEHVAAVDAVLKELPANQLWFTYRDIKRHFGVSRATVARRLRERVVPGVLMQGDHVLEDGAVRRFDRTQLRWLLLAVRGRAHAAEYTRTKQRG